MGILDKKNILILQNGIEHYRKPLYNALSEIYNVTIIHSGVYSSSKEDKFIEIFVKNTKFIKFNFQHKIIQEINSKKYNVVISMFDISWINSILALYIKPKEIKYIWWGIGFGKSKIANNIRLFLSKMADATILYTAQAKNNFSKEVDTAKLYVANNTFYVKNRIKAYKFKNKDILLFVGTLDTRKENDILIKIFLEIQEYISSNIKLVIIGDGKEFKNLKKLSNNNKNIEFKGKIVETLELENYYQRAIASISLGQAGLSVLQSMAYGVPFVTKKSAITGGEITNIQNKTNGILLDDDYDTIKKDFIYMCNNIEQMRSYGKEAYEYYTNYATIELMVQEFQNAVNYVLRDKNVDNS